MQHVVSTHPKGTVAFAAASLSRYSEFWMSLESLQVPSGTRLVASRGADIPHQLNEGVRNMAGEWVWFLGDDHTFAHDTLLKLLEHNVDVVVPVVPRRDYPYVPTLMHGPMAHSMTRYSWKELPTSGLFRLPKNDPAGQAGMLVRRSVLGQLGDPWFEGGKLTPGRLMEDMYFIQRLHDMDIPIWVDCSQSMGHIANITILPQQHKGRWYAGYRVGNQSVLWDEETMPPEVRRNTTIQDLVGAP